MPNQVGPRLALQPTFQLAKYGISGLDALQKFPEVKLALLKNCSGNFRISVLWAVVFSAPQCSIALSALYACKPHLGICWCS